MIKVLHIVSHLYGGGIGNVVVNIARATKDQCIHDAFVYEKLNEDVLEDSNKNFRNVFVGKSLHEAGFKRYKIKINEVLSNNQYDVVHIHTDLYAWIVAKIARENGVKVIIGHAHGQKSLGSPLKCLILGVLAPLFRGLNRKYCTKYIGCSNESIKHMFGCKGIQIPNFLDPSHIIEISNDDKNKLYTEFGLTADNIILGYAGCFDTVKNAIFLPEIIKATNNNKIVLLMAGTSSNMEEIKEKIRVCGVENQVKLIGFRYDMDKIYNILDVYITASVSEGMSMSMVQAQMCGIPVLAYSKLPVVNDVGAGIYYTCDSFNPEEWANQLDKIINDGKVDKDYVYKIMYEKQLTKEKVIKNLLDIYKNNI